MGVELQDSENPVDCGRGIGIFIFRCRTGEVLFDTTSNVPQIPGASVTSGRSNKQELQEKLKRILQSEPHESVLEDTVINGGTEYFFIDGSALEGSEGYSWIPFLKSTTALRNAGVDFDVFSKLLKFMGFDWPKGMAI